MAVRKNVRCDVCGREITRVTWNYSKNRPIQNFFCNKNCKGKWQIAQREKLGYTKEWLIEEYINKKRSADEIAREIGRDPKRVWEWITNYGIETRGRGHNTEHLKKYQRIGYPHTDESKEKIRKARIKDGRLPCYVNGVHWLHHYNRKPASWKGGVTPERQAFYSTEEWSNCVRSVWKRDDAKCKRCGKNHNEQKNRGTFHIHHIVSFMVKEKRADLKNLVLLCADCHRWVHSKKNKNKDFLEEK